MVKGETYNLQIFESEAFRHFINVFTNKQSGVTLGCTLQQNSQYITVQPGYFFIQGGLLREDTGTQNTIPTQAGYYILVYEINLSQTNQQDVFNQGSYKFIQGIGGYPTLTQQDLDNGGTIYQLPFCQFVITEGGLQDFKDIRPIIDYGIYETKIEFGSNDNGNYAKFDDGTLIQWGNHVYYVSTTETFYNLGYRTGEDYFGKEEYPIAFTELNSLMIDVVSDNNFLITNTIKRFGSTNRLTNLPSLTFVSPNNINTSNRVVCSFYAIGRWK